MFKSNPHLKGIRILTIWRLTTTLVAVPHR